MSEGRAKDAPSSLKSREYNGGHMSSNLSRKRRNQDMGVVDYTLAKRALLRDFRQGLLSRLEICDAHPELLRAAKYLGETASQPCPVCRRYELRLLAYVFADGLRRDNGRAFEVADGLQIAANQRGGACYVVEVY